jgi:hypothetical protein
MLDDPDPVIVSFACAAGATKAMLAAASALAARIPLIFRIFSPCFLLFST